MGRRGKHCATFNISRRSVLFSYEMLNVGIIRPLPGWEKKELDRFNPVIVESHYDVSQDLISERTERWGTSDINCCSYDCLTGLCYWTDWSRKDNARWEGQDSLHEDGTIDL